MKAKLVKESINERKTFRKVNKPITTTIGELFTWYNGDDWADDWQTTNTMLVNREHAQDDGKDGMTYLKILGQNAQENIDVQYTEDINGYDVWFVLDGDEYSFQSSEIPFEDEDY